jgi:hypothetical protein
VKGAAFMIRVRGWLLTPRGLFRWVPRHAERKPSIRWHAWAPVIAWHREPF